MPTVSRSRTVGAEPDDVWRVVADPHHLPRWWPRVARVERAGEGSFTQVLMTRKGRPVRADFHLAELEEPRGVAWEQDLVGTPFERLLHSARTEVALAPAGAGTEITLTVRQKLRGWSRVGPFFFRSAARKQLDEALAGLERACG
jgi:carbon monoxide dehydrogenase subunit G